MSGLSRTHVCHPIKGGNVTVMERAADRIRNAAYFRNTSATTRFLFPVPGHAPMREDTVWPAQMIAEALVRWGLAQSWTPILKRTAHIEKSATFLAGGPSIANSKRSMRCSRCMRRSHGRTVAKNRGGGRRDYVGRYAVRGDPNGCGRFPGCGGEGVRAGPHAQRWGDTGNGGSVLGSGRRYYRAELRRYDDTGTVGAVSRGRASGCGRRCGRRRAACRRGPAGRAAPARRR